MGVYHLMGLGRSLGAVTGPLSYLGFRFERWDEADREFFRASGEVQQRLRGEKVGDVQALILMTTSEIISGQLHCYDFIDNPGGTCPTNMKATGAEPLPQAIKRLLGRIWPRVAPGKRSVKLYWAEVDRTDLLGTFQRSAEVISAAKSAGGLGKELWINLTGGNNVVNLALQFAAGLTGSPSRFYYVQAENPSAEKCIRYTRANGYWVDLPLLPFRVDEAARRLVELLASLGDTEANSLFTQAKRDLWQHFQDVNSPDQFRRLFLQPLVFQGLLELEGDAVRTGPGWPRLEPYYRALDRIGTMPSSFAELTAQPWFREEEVGLS